jgi:hypothetical protein
MTVTIKGKQVEPITLRDILQALPPTPENMDVLIMVEESKDSQDVTETTHAVGLRLLRNEHGKRCVVFFC